MSRLIIRAKSGASPAPNGYLFGNRTHVPPLNGAPKLLNHTAPYIGREACIYRQLRIRTSPRAKLAYRQRYYNTRARKRQSLCENLFSLIPRLVRPAPHPPTPLRSRVILPRTFLTCHSEPPPAPLARAACRRIPKNAVRPAPCCPLEVAERTMSTSPVDCARRSAGSERIGRRER